MMSIAQHPSARIQRTLLVVLAAVLQVSQTSAICNLCEDGVYGLHYPKAVIKSDGTTCTGMAMDLASDYTEGSNSCNQQIQAWSSICCGDDEPIDVDVTDVFDEYPDIDSIETTGPYPKCDVCRDGDYPSSSSMAINMLYIGSGTCPQYWKAGQQGLIPTHLCDPLQYFAYEPCGCGEYSTNGNYDWGDDDDYTYDGGSSSTSSSSSSSGSSSGSSSSNTYDGDDDWWKGADTLSTQSDTDDDNDQWWSFADSKTSQAPTTVTLSYGLGLLFISMWLL